MDGGLTQSPEGRAMNETRAFDPATDPRAFRDTLGQFATGVTVVTCQTDKGPVAITANSFASLSLDPPLVLWSPARASARFAPFTETDRYAIHVLEQGQAEVGRRFAKDGWDFEHAEWHACPDRVPLLAGCLARFECRKVAVHEGGDHVIVVGEVLRATPGDGAPLIFAQGRYGGFTAQG